MTGIAFIVIIATILVTVLIILLVRKLAELAVSNFFTGGELIRDIHYKENIEKTKETQEEFIARIYREQEEVNQKWEEKLIQFRIQEDRLKKLKAPKPKWIQQ